MTRSQNNGITILLGLENYRLGEIWGEEDRITIKAEVSG